MLTSGYLFVFIRWDTDEEPSFSRWAEVFLHSSLDMVWLGSFMMEIEDRNKIRLSSRYAWKSQNITAHTGCTCYGCLECQGESIRLSSSISHESLAQFNRESKSGWRVKDSVTPESGQERERHGNWNAITCFPTFTGDY